MMIDSWLGWDLCLEDYVLPSKSYLLLSLLKRSMASSPLLLRDMFLGRTPSLPSLTDFNERESELSKKTSPILLLYLCLEIFEFHLDSVIDITIVHVVIGEKGGLSFPLL